MFSDDQHVIFFAVLLQQTHFITPGKEYSTPPIVTELNSDSLRVKNIVSSRYAI